MNTIIPVIIKNIAQTVFTPKDIQKSGKTQL